MIRALLIIAASLWASLAAAQDNRSDQIIAAFERWMATQGVSEGSIAILQDGTPLIEKGYGREAQDPVTLASLSKAITGVCIAILQQEGVFDLTSELSDLIDAPEGSGKLGPYLSHTSGLWPDRTQSIDWHLQDNRTPRHADATRRALAGKREDSSFRYSNENYAILGSVIDAVAQDSYEADCRALILDPIQITTAALDPVWGPHGAWGGWSMSVGDYARFVGEYFANRRRHIGRSPLQWPTADIGRGRHYVMGAYYRNRRGTNLFWHSGKFCWGGKGHGASFVSYGGEPVVVVSFAACIENDGYAALDKALFEAAMPN
jgi:CubicO group peptidase (beta-lactamase class C family)